MDPLPISGSILANLLRYQVVWFGTVLGTGYDRPDLGLVLGTAMLIWHFVVTRSPKVEWCIVLITLLIGGIWEWNMVHFGVVDYRGSPALAGVPVWILLLWAGFGCTLNGCLGWFRRRLGIAAVLGGLVGPLSWYGGAKIGALTMPDPASGYLILGMGWFLMMPLLSGIAAKLLVEYGDEEQR